MCHSVRTRLHISLHLQGIDSLIDVSQLTNETDCVGCGVLPVYLHGLPDPLVRHLHRPRRGGRHQPVGGLQPRLLPRRGEAGLPDGGRS